MKIAKNLLSWLIALAIALTIVNWAKDIANRPKASTEIKSKYSIEQCREYYQDYKTEHEFKVVK